MVLTHLIPLGRGRYDLYAEAPDEDDGPLAHDAGRMRRWLHSAGEQWRDYVDAARVGTATSGLAKFRDTIICKLAQSLDEQRTLRGLRTTGVATLLFPATLEAPAARAALDRILGTARRHHGQRLAIYLALFIVSGVLAVLPGPNAIAYYFGFQAFGHLQAWRGARQATSAVQWTLTPSEDLAELADLAERPHQERAPLVDAVAHRLHLEHLAAFFERAAT